MGATYVVGKAAHACQDPATGTTYFLLSEQTYESNVFPQTPRWSPIFFGTTADCMDRILFHSESCEGGMIQGPRGEMSPCAYISDWRQTLAEPSVLSQPWCIKRIDDLLDSVIFWVNDAKEKNAVCESTLATINNTLERFGKSQISSADTLRINLSENNGPAILAALVKDARIAAWKLFSFYTIVNGPSSLGVPIARSSKPDLSGVHVLRLPSDVPRGDANWLLSTGQASPLRHTGWAYSTVQHFIRQFVRPYEIAKPGIAEAAIKAFREKLANAPDAPGDMRVTLDRRPIQDHRYRNEIFTQVVRLLGQHDEVPAFDTTIAHLNSKALVYPHSQLDSRAVTYHYSHADTTAPKLAFGARSGDLALQP